MEDVEKIEKNGVCFARIKQSMCKRPTCLGRYVEFP